MFYFKVYFDINVCHILEDGPHHILTQIRILKTIPRKIRDVLTFYMRTGAWYAHECVLLVLLASPVSEERPFAVKQILKLRGENEYGDVWPRPRITPKLNLSVKSLIKLISWAPGQVDE